MTTRAKAKVAKDPPSHFAAESPHSLRHDGRFASPFENVEDLYNDLPYKRNQSMADFDFVEPDNRKLKNSTAPISQLRMGVKYQKPSVRDTAASSYKKKKSGNRSYYDDPRI